MPGDAHDTEDFARASWDKEDFRTVATIVLDAYGGEVRSFLLARFRGDEAAVDDVFSDFSEDLWKSLPKFGWRCSIRAWCYKLARSAASRHVRSPHNRRDRRAALSEFPFLDELVNKARTSTSPYLRTEVKDEFQRLREKLSAEDQDLLILRVDRRLSWHDIAHAMMAPEDDSNGERFAKMEAALRQRFAEVKRRLKRLAEDAGLLG